MKTAIPQSMNAFGNEEGETSWDILTADEHEDLNREDQDAECVRARDRAALRLASISTISFVVLRAHGCLQGLPEARSEGQETRLYPAVPVIIGRAAELLRDEFRFATSQLMGIVGDQRDLAGTVTAVLERLSDSTHLTVPEVARLREVTALTVRNWIERGLLSLEVMPCTRFSSIPTSQVLFVWFPSRIARPRKTSSNMGEGDE
jgi:hypothetical protein